MADRNVGNRDKVRGLIVLQQDRALAKLLLDQLRSGRRRWDDLTGPERRFLLSRAPLVEYLLESSYGCRFDDPSRMLDLAKKACAVAVGLSRKRYGAEIVADLQARAWAELGNAYRVGEAYEEAGGAFAQAQKVVGEGTRSASLLGRISELMASYFSDLRDFPEAIGLLEVTRDAYQGCGDEKGLDRTLLQLAHVLGQANEPERAVGTCVQALRRSSPGSSNWLPIIQSLATYLAECGDYEVADSLLRRHVRFYRRAGKLMRYRLFWLEGKIAAGLHDYGKAEWKLQTARQGYLYVKKAYDASLVALDLAWVYARQGRRKQVVLLVDQMLRIFQSFGIARESYASLALLRKSCEQQRSVEALCGQIEALAKLFPELASPRRARIRKGT